MDFNQDVEFKDGVVLNAKQKAAAKYLSDGQYKEDLKNIDHELKAIHEAFKKAIANNEKKLNMKIPKQDFYLIPFVEEQPKLTWENIAEYFEAMCNYTESFAELVEKMEASGIVHLTVNSDDESINEFKKSLDDLGNWYKHTRFMQYANYIVELRKVVKAYVFEI